MVAAALAVLLRSNDANAENASDRFRLLWIRGEHAESCPGPEHATRRVVERLGRDPFTATGGWAIEVVLLRDAPRWRAQVVLRDAGGRSHGEKNFESAGDDCSAIAEAATLTAALAVEQHGHETIADDAQVTAPPKTVASARVTPAPRGSEGLALTSAAATIRVFPAWGLMPGAPFGVGNETRLGLGARGRTQAYVAISALWVPYAPARDTSVTFGMTVFGAGGCAVTARAPRVEMLLCGQLLLGALHTAVRTRTPLDLEPSPWGAFTLGHRLAVHPVGALTLELGLDAVVPFQRRTFRVLGSNQLIFEQALATFFPTIGVGAVFY